MKTKYKSFLVILVFLFISLIVTGLGVTYAYYQTPVTGAVTAKAADFYNDLEIVEATHTILPQNGVVVEEIGFYVKNYTGTDLQPTNTSEVRLSYDLTFTLSTNWGTGCTNPISYKLYSINESNSVETEVVISNNSVTGINFDLPTLERDYYKLKLYWDITKNDASCYAGKSGNVGISAYIYQTDLQVSS